MYFTSKKRFYVASSLAILLSSPAFSQKWQQGYFTDVKGVKYAGYIFPNPGGKGPFQNEGFIEFKDNEKANPYKLSTSDLQSFVIGKDSFVVAHAPGNETWAKKEFDFVRVVIDSDTKLYATRGAGSGGGGGGVHFSPSFGLSTGGGYGSSYGGGLGVSLGGGNGGSGDKQKVSFYYGSNTATMQHVTNENFVDVMSDAMGDEPEVVEQIRAGKFNLRNIDKLLAYFEKVKSSHK